MDLWKRVKNVLAGSPSTAGQMDKAGGGDDPLRFYGKPEKALEALPHYEKATQLQPENEKAWYDKGLILLQLNRHEEALGSFEQAIELNPNHADYWRFKGMCLDKVDRLQEALSAYDQVVRLKPNDPDTRMIKGDLQNKAGRHADALHSYEEAISLDPSQPGPWYCKACSLGKLARWDEALLSLGATIKVKTKSNQYPPQYQAWFMKGTVLDIMGRHEEALKAFESSMWLQLTQHADPHARDSGPKIVVRDKDATRSFDEAVSLDTRFAILWFERAEEVIGRCAQEELLANLLESAPTPPPKRKPSLENVLSMIQLDESIFCIAKGASLVMLGRHEEALAAFGKGPETARACYFKGLALENLERKEEALSAYEDAIRLDHDYFDAWYSKGLVLGPMGRHDEALKALEEAIRLNPDSAESWYFKGVSLQELRRHDDAMAAFQEAFRLKPGP